MVSIRAAIRDEYSREKLSSLRVHVLSIGLLDEFSVQVALFLKGQGSFKELFMEGLSKAC